MPRYTLTQLFMGTALIAIILTLVQSEGCGSHYAMIQTIGFTSDQSRMVVTKLTGRDADVPMKAYKANIARTVSWLDVSTGANRGVIRQDFKPGNSGPAFQLWYVGRSSVLCNPADDSVAISGFGSSDVECYATAAKPTLVPLQHLASNMTISKSGRFTAVSGTEALTVFASQTGAVAMQIRTQDQPFMHGSLMSFADDDARIVVAGWSGVSVWEIATGKQLSTVIQEPEDWILALAVVPKDSVIACSTKWVRRYDFQGRVIAHLADSGGQLCSASSDGTKLALSDENQLTIYDLTDNSLLRTIEFPYATALALSPAGDLLAVGDHRGQVILFDTATGSVRWTANPPGRYRLPWILPATFLLGWTYAAWRLFKRRKLVAKS